MRQQISLLIFLRSWTRWPRSHTPFEPELPSGGMSPIWQAERRQPGLAARAKRSSGQPGVEQGVQEIAARTSSVTFFSTAGLHSFSAYDTGHMSPSSRFAASWKPRVE